MDLETLYEKYGQNKVDEAVQYLTYKKSPPPLQKTESNENPILYVFRHGQSEDNISMVFSGWRNPKLTEKGKVDALKIADLIKDKKIERLYSSDQIRTIETMKLAISKNERAKKLPIIEDARLKERSYGDWQGTSKLEKHLDNAKNLLEVRRGWDKASPNGESLKMVSHRVNEFLDELIPEMKKSGMNVAVSCSGNSIRPIRMRFEGLTEDEAAKIETPTGKDYAAYEIS